MIARQPGAAATIALNAARKMARLWRDPFPVLAEERVILVNFIDSGEADTVMIERAGADLVAIEARMIALPSQTLPSIACRLHVVRDEFVQRHAVDEDPSSALVLALIERCIADLDARSL